MNFSSLNIIKKSNTMQNSYRFNSAQWFHKNDNFRFVVSDKSQKIYCVLRCWLMSQDKTCLICVRLKKNDNIDWFTQYA